MAIIETQTIETINRQDLDQLSSKTLLRNFGLENDSIALTISDVGGKTLIVDEFFNDYTPYYNTPSTKEDSPKITSIDINYEQVLKDYGYLNGTYLMDFSFQRKLINNTVKKSFYISEISPSRREIRVKPSSLNKKDFERGIIQLSRLTNNTSYIKDINLDFGNNNIVLILNALLDRDGTGLIKLYNPLPLNLGINSKFRVFEEIINPLEVTVQVQDGTLIQDVGVDIGPPNFNLNNNNIFNVPSSY